MYGNKRLETMASKRIVDLKFLYSRDNGLDQLHAQRQFQDTVSGTLLTPVTPLFTVRVVPSTTKVENPKEFEKRHVLSYIINPNVAGGISKINLAIPYRPGDLNHTAQLREILALPRVDCADYFGESSRAV